MNKKAKTQKAAPAVSPSVPVVHVAKSIISQSAFPTLQLEGKEAQDFVKFTADPAKVECVARVVKEGQEVIQATVNLAGRYRTLVEVMRKENLGILQNRLILKGLGFHKVRVAEIVRVVEAPDKIYSSYVAGAIGLKGALELVRGGLTTNIAAALLPEVSGQGLKAKDLEKTLGDTDAGRLISQELDSEAASGKSKKKSVPYSARVQKLAIALLKLAALGKVEVGVIFEVPGFSLVLEENDIEVAPEASK